MNRPCLLIIAAFCVLGAIPSHAERGYEGLWSLYVYEQTSQVCGFPLTEEQEDDLDEAQRRARIELSLSREKAGELYRRARETVVSAKPDVCNDAERLELGLNSLQGRPG